MCASHSEPKLMNTMGDQTGWWCFSVKNTFRENSLKTRAHNRLLFTPFSGADSLKSFSFILNPIVSLVLGINFPSGNATDIRETNLTSSVFVIWAYFFFFWRALRASDWGFLWFIFWLCWKLSVLSLSATVLENRVLLLIFLDWWKHMLSSLTSPTNMWYNL